MRTAFSCLFVFWVSACAGGSGVVATTSGSTGGSIGGTSGSIGTTGGVTCLTTTCATNADCTACGAGYACGEPYTNLCCGNSGTPCAASTDCCSANCDADTDTCCTIFGGSCTSTAACCSGLSCDPQTSLCGYTSPTSGATTAGTGTSSGGATTGGTTSNASTAGASTAATGTFGSSTGASNGIGTTLTGGGTSGGATSSTTGSVTTGTSGTTSGSIGPAFAFTWTFGVSQACESASAAWVTVAINGGTPTVAPCRDENGSEGVTLSAAAYGGGEVGYVVTAYEGVLDTQIGQLSGNVAAPLQGTTPVPVTLPLASGQSSALDLSWTFNGLTAAQAGITSLQVSVTDPKNPNQDVDLTLDGGNGISLPGFGPGFYPVALTGTGLATYTGSANVAANGLTPAVLLADLAVTDSGATGNVVIDFSFNSQSCALAGLDTVSLQLTKSNGAVLAGPINLPCADAGTSYVFSDLAAPATAFLWLEGVAQGQTQQLADPQVAIAPGATSTYTVIAEPSP